MSKHSQLPYIELTISSPEVLAAISKLRITRSFIENDEFILILAVIYKDDVSNTLWSFDHREKINIHNQCELACKQEQILYLTLGILI